MKLFAALEPHDYEGDYSDLSVFEIAQTSLDPNNRPKVYYLKVPDEVAKVDVLPVRKDSEGNLVDSSGRVWRAGAEAIMEEG